MDKLKHSKTELHRTRSQQEKKLKKSSRDLSDSSSSHHAYREEHEQVRRSRSRSRSSSEEKHQSSKARPPPVISKISMNLKTASKSGRHLKLNTPSVKPVFNDESDEEEEMPAECKMRMRNIGKATPTSSGPNSFGKTSLGFVDSKKIFERKMQEMLKEMD